MASKRDAAVGLLLCLSLLCSARGQDSAPSTITIRRLEAVKLTGEKRQPIEIEVRISLQTHGKAVYSLDLFYRDAADKPFGEASLALLPNLKYYVRLPYSPQTEYYLVATPLVGSPEKIDQGKIIGPDLEPSRWSRFDSATGYYAAGAAGMIAVITSVLVHSDQPDASPHVKRNSPLPDIAVGAVIGGAIASIVYWKNRHKKYKQQVGGQASH